MKNHWFLCFELLGLAVQKDASEELIWKQFSWQPFTQRLAYLVLINSKKISFHGEFLTPPRKWQNCRAQLHSSNGKARSCPCRIGFMLSFPVFWQLWGAPAGSPKDRTELSALWCTAQSCPWSCVLLHPAGGGRVNGEMTAMHQGLGRHLCYFCNSASGKRKALSRFTAWLLSTTKPNPLQSKDTSCLCKGRMGYFCVKGNVLMKQGRSTGNKFCFHMQSPTRVEATRKWLAPNIGKTHAHSRAKVCRIVLLWQLGEIQAMESWGPGDRRVMEWFVLDETSKDHLVLTLLPRAGTLSDRSGYSRPHPIGLWTR